jgi:hypothetical protein
VDTAFPAEAPVPAGRFRRCVFRRIDLEARPSGKAASVGVTCLYPDREADRSLGDLTTALPVCAACTAADVFRPDEA